MVVGSATGRLGVRDRLTALAGLAVPLLESDL
jgi:hypothetical protein